MNTSRALQRTAGTCFALSLAVAGSVFADSCIISGSTERHPAAVVMGAAGSLDSAAVVSASQPVTTLSAFDSLFFLRDFGDPLDRFRSDRHPGMILLVR